MRRMQALVLAIVSGIAASCGSDVGPEAESDNEVLDSSASADEESDEWAEETQLTDGGLPPSDESEDVEGDDGPSLDDVFKQRVGPHVRLLPPEPSQPLYETSVRAALERKLVRPGHR